MDDSQIGQLYRDKLQNIAIGRCLRLIQEAIRTEKYDKEHGAHELVDTRSKHVQACLDKVYALHGVFAETLDEFSKE